MLARTVLQIAALGLAAFTPLITIAASTSLSPGAPPARGFAISPAFTSVTVPAGQPQAQFSLKLTNDSPDSQSFQLSTADFSALDEAGGVAFLGQSANQLGRPYGLAAWLVLSAGAVLVPAGQSATVTATIRNDASLAPGGHYGAVLATAVATNQSAAGAGQVGVRQVLSLLILADKQGGDRPSLRLVSQTGAGAGWHLPSQIDQRFHNLGNVHLVPRGTIEIRDPLGRVVARAATNAESAIILPATFRQYHTPLLAVAAAWLPGRYSVVSTYRYDGTARTQVLTTHLWYAGQIVIWLIALLAALAISLLARWLWRRHRS